ncbi:MAG: serpin family protein, partial [Eubacteriales bacterium]|nr:serpin family protein [Eubacteriales bacterium]
ETHIAVDENGVEAAAFTQVNFATTALPLERVEMTLDRPFIFALTAANASLLFIGICENPAD